jgi:hypothetical protein
MMLSLIQTGMDISDIRFDPTQQDHELGQELKILDALAAVCVRKNEIVAVVAAQPDEGSDVTQVIASVTHLNGRKANLTVPQSASSWIDRLWSFLVTPNPRRDETEDSLSLARSTPTIIDPEDQVPVDYKECDTSYMLLKSFLSNW